MPRSASWHWRMIFCQERSGRQDCCRARRSEPANATGPRELATDRDHKLSVKRQAALLGISRGGAYYLPREVA